MRRARAVLIVALVAACSSPRKEEPDETGPAPVPVAITGTAGVKQRDLLFAARRELEAFQKKGRRPADLADAAYAMELELRRRGYAHAAVRFRMDPSEEAPEQVTFEVEEGPQARIAGISFPGARHFDHRQLMRFFPGGSEPIYRRSDVDGGATEVERAYLLAGFRDVEVGRPSVEWNEERSRATVTVPVREGERYRVVGMEFEGDVPEDLRAKIARYVAGLEAYYARLPAEAAARLRAELLDRGYQQARVEAEARIEGQEVTILLRAQAGPQYRLREIRIEGADRTRKRFIRSRVSLHEGSVLEQDRIDRGIDRLYESGIFRTVRARAEGFSEEDGRADLRVELEELAARSVAFDVGWGSYELARGGVRYQDRNFLGFGRRLDAGAHASVRGYDLNASVSDNYLLGHRNTLRLGGTLFRREEPSFTRFGYSFDLSLTHRMDGPYRFSMGYGLDSQEATDVTSGTELAEGEFVKSAGIFGSLVRDTRNNKLLPAKGSLSELGVFWSTQGLGADLNYVELRGNWFGFVPVGDRIVVGFGLRFNSRPILDDLDTLPIQKRLFLGGPTTVRSFRQSRLGPFDPLTLEPLGGLTIASGHVEIRTRVWRELHVATFYEAGMVSERSLTIEGPPGQAIGAGLRYYLPVGPIRLDVGYNPGELFSMSTRWVFHFAFGFSF